MVPCASSTHRKAARPLASHSSPLTSSANQSGSVLTLCRPSHSLKDSRVGKGPSDRWSQRAYGESSIVLNASPSGFACSSVSGTHDTYSPESVLRTGRGGVTHPAHHLTSSSSSDHRRCRRGAPLGWPFALECADGSAAATHRRSGAVKVLKACRCWPASSKLVGSSHARCCASTAAHSAPSQIAKQALSRLRPLVACRWRCVSSNEKPRRCAARIDAALCGSHVHSTRR
mmetsp:Transcript_50242/g.161718  ORF Transcript_50242/g.161718 Transcript_50242/m.161718 type:complete len:230 (-) Transcript_50242:117-806(-)